MIAALPGDLHAVRGQKEILPVTRTAVTVVPSMAICRVLMFLRGLQLPVQPHLTHLVLERLILGGDRVGHLVVTGALLSITPTMV